MLNNYLSQVYLNNLLEFNNKKRLISDSKDPSTIKI